MQQLLQILVAGGDRRQQYAAQKLAKSPQLSVTTIGFSQSDPAHSHDSRICAVQKWELVAARIAVPCEKRRSGVRRRTPRSCLPDVSRTRTVFLRLFSAGGTLSGKCRSNCRGSNSNCHLRTGNSTLRQLCSRHRLRQNRNNHGRAFAGLESRCHRCGSQLQRCGTLCCKWSEMDASV